VKVIANGIIALVQVLDEERESHWQIAHVIQGNDVRICLPPLKTQQLLKEIVLQEDVFVYIKALRVRFTDHDADGVRLELAGQQLARVRFRQRRVSYGTYFPSTEPWFGAPNPSHSSQRKPRHLSQ